MGDDQPHGDGVESLRRGLDVLAALSRAEAPMSLAGVAHEVGTSRATVRRLLLTWERIGYVATDGPTFWLRPRVMELGDIYLSTLALPGVAHPHLVALAERVRDTCSLTVLDGDDVVYVDRVMASRIMTADIAIGTRMPAFATSTGRVLLADLPADARARFLDRVDAQPITEATMTSRADLAAEIAHAAAGGYAIADQEIDPMLRSIAAPVRGPDGRCVAAVNVSTHIARTSREQLEADVLPELLSAADAIAAALQRAA